MLQQISLYSNQNSLSPRSGIKEGHTLDSRPVRPFGIAQAKSIFCLCSGIDLWERPHLVMCQWSQSDLRPNRPNERWKIQQGSHDTLIIAKEAVETSAAASPVVVDAVYKKSKPAIKPTAILSLVPFRPKYLDFPNMVAQP